MFVVVYVFILVLGTAAASSGCTQYVGKDHYYPSAYKVRQEHRLILPHYRIPCAGKVVAWRVLIPDSACRLVAEVWRPIRRQTVFLSANTHWKETVYRLVGASAIVPSKSAFVEKTLLKHEQIRVKAKDVLAVRFYKPSHPGIECLRYLEDINSDGTSTAQACLLAGLGYDSDVQRCDAMKEYPMNVSLMATLAHRNGSYIASKPDHTKSSVIGNREHKVVPLSNMATLKPSLMSAPKRKSQQVEQGTDNQGNPFPDFVLEELRETEVGITTSPTAAQKPSRPPNRKRKRHHYFSHSTLWEAGVVGIGSAFVVCLSLITFYLVMTWSKSRNAQSTTTLRSQEDEKKAQRKSPDSDTCDIYV